jgi:hypothetical protein
MGWTCGRCSKFVETMNHICVNLPPLGSTHRPYRESDIRAAEIRGATWALDHLLGMNEEEVERVLGGTSISAIRIVDARRKEPEGFGPFGES